MKRYFILSLMIAASMVSIADTLTLRQLFVEMPDTLIPYLSKNNRLDFIDFMDSKMKAEVTNELGGKSLMTAFTDDSISLRLNDAAKVDILLLTTTEMVDSCHQVIALVRTFGVVGEFAESVVEYYSLSWRRLTMTPALEADDQKRLADGLKPLNILGYLRKILNKN